MQNATRSHSHAESVGSGLPCASQWSLKSEQHCLNFTHSESQLHSRPLLKFSPHRPLHELPVAHKHSKILFRYWLLSTDQQSDIYKSIRRENSHLWCIEIHSLCSTRHKTGSYNHTGRRNPCSTHHHIVLCSLLFMRE